MGSRRAVARQSWSGWTVAVLAWLLAACGSSGRPEEPAPPTVAPIAPTGQPTASAVDAVPSPAASLSPSPLAAVPSPSPEPGLGSPGDLPADTATLTYALQSGAGTTLAGFQASCERLSQGLGLTGSLIQGPVPARYQLTIVPFHGDGSYRTDATGGEIGGSFTVVGQVQLFVGPPYLTTAQVGRDGALGRVRFSGPNLDGRLVDGTLRWECSSVANAPS
jgi:hypothetical protein